MCLRSYKSAGKAIGLGYTDVSVLKNGLPGWKTAGYETVSRERIPRKAIASVKPVLLKRWLDEGKPLFLLDIRSEEIFLKGHIDGAVNIPFYRLDGEYRASSWTKWASGLSWRRATWREKGLKRRGCSAAWTGGRSCLRMRNGRRPKSGTDVRERVRAGG